ncbi:hypothetical protein [Brevundimonas lenta]|uniref:Uncharacterized protein n=1 Tax=Brevundimonas lenta TaxID=424796 RepID=A0A7W6JAW3_9CAUL|nr:hypothetical protein [Brevundimonas lenta]MBB4081743.1 hypothetical protein [Brevundimonas lenta]
MTNDSDRLDDDACASSKPNILQHKPRIQDAPGETPLAVRATEELLAATGEFYGSGDALVRVKDRDGQGVSIEQVHEQTLKLELARRAIWEVKGRDGIPIRINPPHGVVQALLHGQDRSLPILNGLARQPFFGAEGKLVSTPGYDAASGIFAAFDAADYPMAEPTRELAERSLEYLESLIAEFEFETEADRSAALAAILTAAVRPCLPTAPAINITGTGPGSGKSYLAEVITPFAGPEDPHRVSFPERHDEAGKLVLTVLREKPTAVLFDDMQGNWKSLGPLNRALSSSTTTERMLGKNTSATVSTRVLFLGTGNQVEAERDMRRRLITISLAPRSENPALRSFKSNPVDDLRQHRSFAVSCALNIIRAFQAAGEPMADVRAVNNYDAWSRMCRHPLVWLGLSDPAQSLIDQVSKDPEKDLLAEFLAVWFRIFGSRPITVRRLLAKANQHDDLMEILEELPVMDGRHVSPGKLGWYISKRKGRWAGGLKFERGDSSERNSWMVVTD